MIEFCVCVLFLESNNHSDTYVMHVPESELWLRTPESRAMSQSFGTDQSWATCQLQVYMGPW